MPDVIRTMFALPEGYASRLVAHLAYQMESQRQELLEVARDLTAEELAWQPASGMNTIGTLLAHIAYAEFYLVRVGVEEKGTEDAKDVVGVTAEDVGLPLGDDADAPPALAGKDLPFFRDLLDRSRAYSLGLMRSMTDDDLNRVIVRTRPDGTRREFNVGWVLYHVMEHEVGHRGQIGMLRHLRRKLGN